MKTLLTVMLVGTVVSAFAEFNCLVKVDEGEVGQSRTATVSYAGGGSVAPLVRVEAGENAYVRISEADGWAKSVEFLAFNGAGSQSFFCLADATDAKLELSYTSGSSEAIPWTTLGPSLKPSYVSEAAWQYALVELRSRLGSTWSDYLSRLQANAECLAELGYETCRTDRLLGLEINRALGVNVAVPTLASATDIARSARGFPLAYSRSFSSATHAHFNKGALGYGWTDNYAMYADRVDEKTLAIRQPSGGAYSFSKLTGDWQPEDARDKTVLSETAEGYVLTDESGTVLTFAKSNMRLKRMADNVGNALTFAWDGVKLLSVTHSDGQSLTFSYNAAGQLASVKDDLGNGVTYAYDDTSMLTSVTGVDGLVTRYAYKTSSSDLGTALARTLVSITNPDQTTSRYGYEPSSARLVSVDDGAGCTVRLAYSDVAKVEVTAADGGVTQVWMGPSGEALKTTDALGGVVTRTYDADGLLKLIVAPSGRTSSYSHDARGRVATQTSAAGNVTALDYTELFGNLNTLKDARGKSVAYGYDDKGRATSVQFPDGSKMLVEYNARGDVSKTTNCRGQSESYTYDAEGRVSSRAWANGRTFTYAYDAKGRLVSASDSMTGTVTMEYDTADLLTRIAYPDNHGFTFTYDPYGRLTKRQSFDGAAECFAYDAAGRLAEVTDGAGNRYLRNTYDSTTGRLTKQDNGNGTSTEYLYDLLGRVVSIEHKDSAGKIAEALQYCYEEDGRCIRAASLLGEERYGYDDEGQLTSVEYPVGENETFAYDAVGNRTSANGESYVVNNLNQYTSVGSALRADRFTYDADGNMTSRTSDADGTTTYTYDQQNRLVAVKNAAKNLDWSCAYDVLGNRVSVTENGVTTKRVLLPGSLPSVAAEYRNGALVKRHVVVGATRLAEISGEAASSPLDQNSIRYYHGDLIGSTRLITDSIGATKSRLSYKSFGEVRSHYGEIPAAGYVGTLGVETDATGLLFMRNRYYDPTLGRFIQRDPIGLSGGDVNWYRYCGNSPQFRVDPVGLLNWGSVKAGLWGFAEGFSKGVAWASLAVAGVAVLAMGGGYLLVGAGAVTAAGATSAAATGMTMLLTGTFGLKVSLAVSGAAGFAGSLLEAAEQDRPVGLADSLAVLGSSTILKDTPVTDLAVGLGKTMLEYFCDSADKQTISLDKEEPGDSGGGSGGTGGGGSGGGGSGGGSIMSEADWLDIVLKLSKNDAYKAATYSLGADITITDLRCRVAEFTGTLNGNGHTITYQPTHSGDIEMYNMGDDCALCAGAGARFLNVNFKKGGVTCKGGSFAGCFADGGHSWVLSAENCEFSNCFAKDAPLVVESSSCTFENCHSEVNISMSDKNFVGALVAEAASTRFTSCSVSGSIVGGMHVGGLVGNAKKCTFENCVSSANVTGVRSVGGVAGDCTGVEISNCRASGRITGAARVGGLLGDISGGKITDCSATGNVYGDASLALSDSSEKTASDIGGFAGSIGGDVLVSNCAATGNVDAPDETNVGGFVGSFGGTSKVLPSVSRSYASGNVVGANLVGGFSGMLNYCKVTDCYAVGDVTALGYVTGALTTANAGGFAGSASTTTGTELSHCYASGHVSASGSTGVSNTGGLTPFLYAALAGYLPESQLVAYMEACDNCYWNKNVTGQSYSGMGTKALSGAEMKQADKFSGWDFSATWAMGSDGPYLRALGKTGEISPLKISVAATAKSVRSVASLPSLQNAVSHHDAFARYVLVKGYDYSFLMTTDAGVSISASDLPEGLALIDGCLTGKTMASGKSSATISIGDSVRTVTFEVIDAPTGFAEQYTSAGGTVPGGEDPGEDPGGDDPEVPVGERSLTLSLSQGWNWISLNVVPADATLGSVFAGVSFADEDVVKSAAGLATYIGGKWYGELAALKPGVAYMVKKSTAGTAVVTVVGTAVEPSVVVAAGWNWIGCTATDEVPLDALSHSRGFSDEDTITSADAVSTYYGGKWYGELEALRPGAGYKVKLLNGGKLQW